MIREKRKHFIILIIYCSMLLSFFTFVLLDTFVISKTITKVSESTSTTGVTATSSTTDDDSSESISSTTSLADPNLVESTPVVTDMSYSDENLTITIDTVRKYDSTLYIADITLSDASLLKTAFAENSFGRNIKQITSEIATENNAIFAINGDFYGFRTEGFVLRNGEAYQTTARDSESDDALVIDVEGNFSIVDESTTDFASIAENAWQILTFGPALIDQGTIQVTASSEVGQSMSSNPRTAIGQIEPLHYIVIVSDGRTSESEGLTLLQLAETFSELGCTTAYNLDGGGSSTMYFDGEIINVPTDGRKNGERAVSDIVYFGYE